MSITFKVDKKMYKRRINKIVYHKHVVCSLVSFYRDETKLFEMLFADSPDWVRSLILKAGAL